MTPVPHHRTSASDDAFREAFEAGAVAPGAFDHRAHVRLAYIYLTAGDTDSARQRMHGALLNFLRRHGVDESKYHETMTSAWILAVRHFMESSPASESADAFIAQNPRLLDSKIMLTHYSAALLFSPEARARFVEPDLSPIPKHNERG